MWTPRHVRGPGKRRVVSGWKVGVTSAASAQGAHRVPGTSLGCAPHHTSP